MKIIYDNIIFSLQKSGGISVYWNNLENGIDINKSLVYKNASKNIFYKKRNSNCYINKTLIFERYLNPFIYSHEPYIFHSSYYRLAKSSKAVNITTVHDFTYEYFRKDLFSLVHKHQKKNAILNSDGVICISNNTLRDLYKYYPNYTGLATVIYHGFNDTIFRPKNLKRNNNIIFIGSRDGYKNFSLAVNILQKLSRFTLIIIGGGSLKKYELDDLNLKLMNRFQKIDFVSDEELATIYNESFALLYPSSYEGFGLPILESQACGCPVICQKISSIPEVSGDACIYISNNIENTITNINNLFNNEFYVNLQNSGIKNSKIFTWEKTIQKTKEFYYNVYKRRGFK